MVDNAARINFIDCYLSCFTEARKLILFRKYDNMISEINYIYLMVNNHMLSKQLALSANGSFETIAVVWSIEAIEVSVE